MQSTSDFSTDPILRRIEQDMAPNSGTSSPQRDAPSPAPSSTISSLFSKALSFGGATPTGTPKNIVPSSVGSRSGYRQSSLFDRTGSVLGRPFSNLLSPRTENNPRHGSHHLPRQRSLESSESVSPSGSSHFMGGTSRYRGQLVRRRSEGGEDVGSYLSDLEGSVGSYPEGPSSSMLRTTMLGGNALSSAGIQGPTTQRFRPPFNRAGGMPPPRGAGRGMRSRPPFLNRGRSMDTPTSNVAPYSPSLPPSASLQHGSIFTGNISSSQPSTSIISSNFQASTAGSTFANETSSQRQYSRASHTDYMSAPEGGGWGSGYESSGGLEGNKMVSNLYPHVNITTDSGDFGRNNQQKESYSSYQGGVVSSTSVPSSFSSTSSTTNITTNTAYTGLGRSSLLDPRSAVHPPPNTALTAAGQLSTNVPSGTTGGFTRRKLDSTFRTDSLSSDQSDTRVRPPPPKPHKSKRSHRNTAHPNRAQALDGTNTSSVNFSQLGNGLTDPNKAFSGSGRSRASGSSGRGKAFGASSSDDEIRSTDFTSCGEEMESESISEKGKLLVNSKTNQQIYHSTINMYE